MSEPCGDKAECKLHLFDLPNEVLVHILNIFETSHLLRFTLICTRFHDLILRILHFRLLLAASAPEYKIILEAYHPSRKNTRPYLFCTYLGTDGLSSQHEGEGSLYHDCEGVTGKLGKLSALYSRFRPENPDVEGSIPMRRIAGATPVLAQPPDGSDPTPAGDWTTSTGPTTPVYRNAGDGGNKKIVYNINLDGGELFGQFCAYASLVRLGPRRGVFLSTVNVVEPGQGTIRVWRHWLLDRCADLVQAADMDVASPAELEHTMTNSCPNFEQDKRILWTDSCRNVGLRVSVRQRNPVSETVTGEDPDELPLSCIIEIQELVVRTTHLMLAVEASIAAQEKQGSGKALIFGNFATSRTVITIST